MSGLLSATKKFLGDLVGYACANFREALLLGQFYFCNLGRVYQIYVRDLTRNFRQRSSRDVGIQFGIQLKEKALHVSDR